MGKSTDTARPGGAGRARQSFAVAALLVVVAALAGLALIAAGGLRSGRRIGSVLGPPGEPAAAAASCGTPTACPYTVLIVTATPLAHAMLERGVPPLPTGTAAPPSSATPSSTPTMLATLTLEPDNTDWTQEEKNALSWLCYGEARGMGENKVDACLSIISTVRVRYAVSTRFTTTTMLEVLTKPFAFSVPIDALQPSPDAEINDTVALYQRGIRGSCTGYLYFDSVERGPHDCVIYGPDGQFIEFYSVEP